MEDSEEIFGPNNTVIVFDLHHVICKPNYTDMILHVLSDEDFWSKFSLVFCDPSFLLSSLHSLASGEHIEKTVLKTQKRYGRETEQLYRLVREVCNCQEIQTDIIDIVKNLKQKGYRVYIFSNISKRFMVHLQSKHTQIFDLFDAIYTTDESIDYLQKPHRQAFQNFLDTHVPEESYQVIFVDDSFKNVEMAKDMGMFGIHYTSTELLVRQLEKLLPLDG